MLDETTVERRDGNGAVTTDYVVPSWLAERGGCGLQPSLTSIVVTPGGAVVAGLGDGGIARRRGPGDWEPVAVLGTPTYFADWLGTFLLGIGALAFPTAVTAFVLHYRHVLPSYRAALVLLVLAPMVPGFVLLFGLAAETNASPYARHYAFPAAWAALAVSVVPALVVCRTRWFDPRPPPPDKTTSTS